MSESKLLDCPFCGGEARYNVVEAKLDPVTREPINDTYGGEYIDCVACGASTNLLFPLMESVRALLAEKWNTRAPRTAVSLAAERYGRARAAWHAASASRDPAPIDFRSIADEYRASEQDLDAALAGENKTDG